MPNTKSAPFARKLRGVTRDAVAAADEPDGRHAGALRGDDSVDAVLDDDAARGRDAQLRRRVREDRGIRFADADGVRGVDVLAEQRRRVPSCSAWTADASFELDEATALRFCHPAAVAAAPGIVANRSR